MENVLLISDAAKEVQVESHVLRYWEEELHLPIHRNELGHRYYTKEDVERFKQIKGMKERGLQLKAIKMILKDGKLDVMMPEEEKEEVKKQELAINVVENTENPIMSETREEKARRLQWLLQQMIRETLQENNKELCRDIQENVVKELDYQFRMQEERDEERSRIREEREEIHYQKLDELLRSKSGRRAADKRSRPPKPVKPAKEKGLSGRKNKKEAQEKVQKEAPQDAALQNAAPEKDTASSGSRKKKVSWLRR